MFSGSKLGLFDGLYCEKREVLLSSQQTILENPRHEKCFGRARKAVKGALSLSEAVVLLS